MDISINKLLKIAQVGICEIFYALLHRSISFRCYFVLEVAVEIRYVERI
jgi:hypothetical protein